MRARAACTAGSALLLSLVLLGCGGAHLDPSRAHSDPRVEQWYQAWLAAGEPPLGGSASGHELGGRASWYGPTFHGRRTANGEVYDMYGMTAAHRTLPFGTIVRVRRAGSRQEVVVRVNDRGPYVKGRILDLSFGAAADLGMVDAGVVDVELDVVAWGTGRRVAAR